jgi:EmrB/QacA subfamily drug resistance transporter
MSTTADAAESREGLTPDLLNLALVIVVGTFVVQMDGTMINVALATMQRSFHGTVTTIQWIATGYLLAMAVAVPPAGWAAERFGSRPVWLGALAVFMAGSVLCGIAWSVGGLVAFRVFQGLSGGVLLPLSQAILAQAAGPERLGRLMAVVGVPALLGPVVGPVVGGILIDQLTWRWIFFINVPVCLAAILLSLRYMPSSVASRTARLDVVGLALLSPALAGIVYGLSEAGNHGTFATSRAIIPLAIGGALTLAFAVHALRTRYEPIIDLRLMASREFAAASATILLVVMALLGAMLLVPLYYQTVRGATALHAGLLLAPQGLGAAVGIAVCSRLVDRLAARPIAVVGVVLSATGLLVFTQIGTGTQHHAAERGTRAQRRWIRRRRGRHHGRDVPRCETPTPPAHRQATMAGDAVRRRGGGPMSRELVLTGRHGIPVVVTEFGCATYAGAAKRINPHHPDPASAEPATGPYPYR